MKSKYSLLGLLSLALVSYASPSGERQGQLAVIEVENTSNDHTSFVVGLPDMIVTELMKQTGEELVERNKIQSAMKELRLDGAGFTQESSLKVGQWVGAERILLGTFSRIHTTFRLDLRVVEVESGRIICASDAMQDRNLLEMVPNSVQGLLTCLEPMAQSVIPNPIVQPEAANPVARSVDIVPKVLQPVSTEPCMLRINHKIVLSLFTQRPVPYQRIRVFLDDKLLHTSTVLDAVNKDFTVYNGVVPPGIHQLRMEHGVSSKDGQWKRLLDEQPESLTIHCSYGSQNSVSYRMKVWDRSLEFNDYRVN